MIKPKDWYSIGCTSEVAEVIETYPTELWMNNVDSFELSNTYYVSPDLYTILLLKFQ